MRTSEDELLLAWAALYVTQGLAVKRIQKDLEAKGCLALDDYEVLLVTSRCPDQRIRLSSLAESTIFTKSGITRVVNRLEESGLLRREGCPNDKRGSFAILTAAGKEALKSAWRVYSRSILTILSPSLTATEARELRCLLEKILCHLRNDTLVPIGPRKQNKAE
ncbi:MAG: MarR family transcriptional regulator [Oligoflexia bacterium]|nr:MarR family transcriptional regulator [Oligoflexia bacterium]